MAKGRVWKECGWKEEAEGGAGRERAQRADACAGVVSSSRREPSYEGAERVRGGRGQEEEPCVTAEEGLGSHVCMVGKERNRSRTLRKALSLLSCSCNLLLGTGSPSGF